MEKAKDEKDVIGLICIDIDDFKKISDGMGIVIGDELLQVFGQYLKEFECDDIMETDNLAWFVKQKDWDKVYQKYMDTFRNWLSENKDNVLKQLNTLIFKR